MAESPEDQPPLLWLTRFVFIWLNLSVSAICVPVMKGARVEGGRAQELRRLLRHPETHLS